MFMKSVITSPLFIMFFIFVPIVVVLISLLVKSIRLSKDITELRKTIKECNKFRVKDVEDKL